MKDEHKSYANKRHTKLEFVVGDMVFVKVSLLRHVMRFGSSKKQAPRFAGTFTITGRIGKLAYRVELLEKLAGVYMLHLQSVCMIQLP